MGILRETTSESGSYFGGLSRAQALWDKTFLLRLFDCSEEPLDNLKIQKIIFISEDKARSGKMAAAFFPFFRYDFGPFSKVVADDVSALERRGFIDLEFRRPTERGKYILEYVGEFIKDSPKAIEALELLRSVCEKYKNTKSSQLVDIVYAMNVAVCEFGGEIMQVRDIPKCVDILVPNSEGLETVIPFPDDLLNDLDIEFSGEESDPYSPENTAYATAALDRALSS